MLRMVKTEMTKKTKKQMDYLCRLCGGTLDNFFTKKILGKYDISYYKCSHCHSLQTEKPYWLHEAYKKNTFFNTDTGAVQRNLHNLAACFTISKLIKTKNVIDIGGGDGLLCRLLRDYKINCYVKDKYAIPTYGLGFTEENFNKPDLIIGFEVLEHYPNPISDLEDLFSRQPRALLLSTAIYNNEKQDWWYLSPESGQHVFFYSKKAMTMIAAKYEYELIISGGFILLVKNLSPLTKVVAKILLKALVLRLLKSIIFFLATPGVWQDHLLQVEKSKDGNRPLEPKAVEVEFFPMEEVLHEKVKIHR
jgi:2-polyprenyl-3-methyl-5-hydroxy-6-metoxy-1,4-benzoquinol methylase